MKTLRSASSAVTLATVIAAGLAPGVLNEARGSVSYLTPGSTYFQNFDSLPKTPQNVSLQATIPWTDDSTSSSSQTSLLGWYLYHPTSLAEGGANGHQRLRIGAGSAVTGSFMSFGAASANDRALGDIGSSTIAPDIATPPDGNNLYLALRLHNDTGETLERFTLSYYGEQWHGSGVSTPETMTFSWSTAATSVSDASSLFTAVPTLGWTAPVTLGAEGAVDGNVNRVAVGPVIVTGFSWAPGTDLWLRWTDPQTLTVRDDGMALDDLSFFAEVPEPSTIALLGLGLAGLLARRRR